MPRLTELRSYDDVLREFSWDALWALFDGTRDAMNLAHECIDRHRGTAVTIQYADGQRESLGFEDLSALTGQFAHWLVRRGVGKGDRVAIVLDPCKAFYVSLFGAVKRGAIAVPLFTLFGPDGLALRIRDCKPRLVLTAGDAEGLRAQFPDLDVVNVDEVFWAALAQESTAFVPSTAAGDLAVFQYTSGTTRELPEAVKHTHRAVVTLMIAALFGIGLRPGDRYFCPSSPAWGHGLWHGTIAPLALGIHIAAYSGRFDPLRMFEALDALHIDNFAAAATVFRMMRNSGLEDRFRIRLAKASFTGEPIDDDTADWVERTFGTPACSMYGTTEVGVILVNYPGLPDYRGKRGALGKPAPGWEVAVVDANGQPVPAGASGEIAVRRKGEWFLVKDRGRVDDEGYFFHEGRSDDVIISAGWTMSALEIERTLLKHPAVAEAAVVAVPDAVRGQVAKAYIVARQRGADVVADIQAFMKRQLAQHEYPRAVEFVDELPKTPAGKVNRKALRDAAKAASP
jgi:acetyl-CoA synthetase